MPQLLNLLTSLHDRGIVFRALETPIDTSGPNGLVVLDTLRAVLSLNNALLRARKRAIPPHAPLARRIELMKVIADVVLRCPGITLRRLATELERLGYRPLLGGPKWSPTSIKLLLDRARLTGLLIER